MKVSYFDERYPKLYKIHKNHYKVKQSVIFRSPEIEEMNNFMLYELDYENMIHLNYMFLDVQFDWQGIANLTYDVSRSQTMKLHELFGCHSHLENFDQIKAIIYKDKKFYILLRNRQYLEFKDNLVDLNFDLKSVSTQPKQKHLKFLNLNDLENVTFDITSHTKWTKLVNEGAYYLQFFEHNIYAIWIDEPVFSSNELVAQKVENDFIRSLKCDGQIVVVGLLYYCFNETTFYVFKMYSPFENITNIANISDIFEKSKFEYSSSQELLFAFTIEEQKLVMITRANIFVIPFDLLVPVRINGKAKVTLKGETNFDVKKNCLFNKCV